jgi:uncharacterized protein YjdB
MENRRSNISKVTIIVFVIVFVVGIIAGFLLVRGFFKPTKTTDIQITETVAVESVRITNPSIVLNVGGTTQLITAVYPSNATDQSVRWESDSPNIASINQTGLLTALAIGDAIITAKTNDGDFTATITAKVTATPIEVVPITAIGISGGRDTIIVGERLPLTATFTPRNATPSAVTWSSSNPNFATVTNTGSVTGVLPGSVVITVRTTDGKFTSTHNLTVEKVAVESIGITGAKNTIGATETISLTATVLPASATYKNITWVSNNENVATVNSSGLVTAVSAGAVTITATSVDNPRVVGQYSLRVDRAGERIPITKITIVGEDKRLRPKETLNLSVNIEPEAAINQRIVWTSNNNDVATVVEGIVTAISSGAVTITASSLDGTVSDSRSIRIDR